MIIEEDRLILHDLRGVNLKVDFFFGSRKEFLQDTSCISYSICWDSVDVIVDQVTIAEQLSDLDFYYQVRQLYIDDHILSGDVFSLRCERDTTGLITAFCTILLGRDY